MVVPERLDLTRPVTDRFLRKCKNWILIEAARLQVGTKQDLQPDQNERGDAASVRGNRDRAVVAGEPQKIVRIAQYLHRWPALCLKTCQKQKFK